MSRDRTEELIGMTRATDTEKLEIDEIDTPKGVPLSAEEIRQAQQELAKWLPPDAFKFATDTYCSRCHSPDWFNSTQLKFLHDAFVLARFAQHQRVAAVRLAAPSEQWPDGYVRLDGRDRNVEITSTHGGRKLGDEYREPKGLAMDPVENWIERADSIPKYLDEAIGAKSNKRYSSPCWLVVYLNISEYGIRQKETEVAIEEIKARYAPYFEAISVLWKGRLY